MRFQRRNENRVEKVAFPPPVTSLQASSLVASTTSAILAVDNNTAAEYTVVVAAPHPLHKGQRRFLHGFWRVWSGAEWYCEHGRRKAQCALCTAGDSQRIKGLMVQRDGKARIWGGTRWLCEHRRQIGKCGECAPIEPGATRTIDGEIRIWSGSEWQCRHGRRKNQCQQEECQGSSFCPCGIRREDCKSCTTDTRRFGNGRYCVLCGRKKLSMRRLKGGCTNCAECDPSVPPRWEHIVWQLVAPHLPPPSIRDNALLGGERCGSARTRPDVCWIGEDRIVHLEIDEDSHVEREVSCELRKLDSANWGFLDSGVRERHRPTLVVRFNPNSFDRARTPLEERCRFLVQQLRDALTGSIVHWDDLRLNVIYLYMHSKADHHIEAALQAVDSIKVLSVIGGSPLFHKGGRTITPRNEEKND